MGTLFIVATPIGNRDDISTRSMQVLGDVDFIAAEDTRHTGQLLAFIGVKKPMISFRDAPSPVMNRSLLQICDRLNKGQSGAYVTDAGTPGISDPGWRLVEAVLQINTQVVPIPGPSAITALLSVAHMALDEYRFIGFLPKKKGHQTKLEDIAAYLDVKETRGVVFYESPARIRKTLQDMMAIMPEARVLIGRELTKKFETIYRSKLTKDFIDQLPEKGEYVILLHN
jgi:16S rRNA (cytidine1402-2'-O)-methyltransferase